MKEVINPWWLWTEIMPAPIMVAVFDYGLIEASVYICIVLLSNILVVLKQTFTELQGIHKDLQKAHEKSEDVNRNLKEMKELTEEQYKRYARINEERMYLLAQLKADVHNYTTMYTHR